MKLNVTERLIALGCLPKEGNFITLKVLREAVDVLGLSSEELTKLNVVTSDDGHTTWDVGAEMQMGEVDVKLSSVACTLLTEELKKLDSTNKLTPQHFTLYEKFVIGK